MYGQQTNLQTIKAPTVWAGGQMGSAQVILHSNAVESSSPHCMQAVHCREAVAVIALHIAQCISSQRIVLP